MLTDYQQELEQRYEVELEAARKSRNAAVDAYKYYAVQGIDALLNFSKWGEQCDYEYFEKMDAMARVVEERIGQWDVWINWLETASVEEVVAYLEGQMAALTEKVA